MNLSFRICTETDLELADHPFVAAYEFTQSRKALLYQHWLLQPDGWWLASLDEQPVGFGGAVDYGPFSYIGMIAVHPSVQHRGIGTALMQQILAWGDARGCPTMLLDADEQAVSLYKRLGFIEETTIPKFIQTKRITLPQLSSHIQKLQGADIPDVAAFDAPYFGANRAKVLASHLKESPEGAFVSRTKTGQITGYIFTEPRFLGPWVASSVEVAEQLLIRALLLPFADNLSVTLPISNQEGQRLLKRYGFVQRDVNFYMRRGAPAPFRQPDMLYGEASSALG